MHSQFSTKSNIVPFIIHLLITSNKLHPDVLLLTIMAMSFGMSYRSVLDKLQDTLHESEENIEPWKKLKSKIELINDPELSMHLDALKQELCAIDTLLAWKERKFTEHLQSHATPLQFVSQLQGLQTREVSFEALNDIGLNTIILLSELKAIPRPPKHFLVPMIEPSLGTHTFNTSF